MRFASLLAATVAAVAARPDDIEFVDVDAFKAPEVPDESEFSKASYYRRVKDPNVRARYKNAMDRCKGHSNQKKRYQCFKRNWNLFKPHRQNKLNDLRARTHRACWKYKNNILKRAKCFDKYIKDYKGELSKGLLADDEQQKQAQNQVEQQFQQAAEGADESEEEAFVQVDHVNERELSSASSTDSEESSSSSEDTSDDNNHKARVPTANKLASGERRAGRRERLNTLKRNAATRRQ